MQHEYVFENHLSKLLKDRSISQKELAEVIKEREATISDFANFKRGSVNMEMLLKISSFLQLSTVDELLSFKRLSYVPICKQNEWHTLNECVKFGYFCSTNKQTFELAEVFVNATLTHQRYDITELNENMISELFEQLGELESVASFEDETTRMLIEICRYKGEVILTSRRKTKKEALIDLDILF